MSSLTEPQASPYLQEALRLLASRSIEDAEECLRDIITATRMDERGRCRRRVETYASRLNGRSGNARMHLGRVGRMLTDHPHDPTKDPFGTSSRSDGRRRA